MVCKRVFEDRCVDGLYLTMVKQTEHVIRRLESCFFGYKVDLSDLFDIGSPNPIYLHIRQVNWTQPELTRSLEADLIAKPNSDKAHQSLGSTKEPGGTIDRPDHSAQHLSDRYGLKQTGLTGNNKERHLVISRSLLYANAMSSWPRPINQP